MDSLYMPLLLCSILDTIMITKIEIYEELIDIEAFRLAMSSDEVGAMVEFSGVVRREEQGEAIDGLHYEAYSSMAIAEMEGIVRRLNASFPVDAVAICHRIGWIPVGDVAIYVQVLSKHRGEAFTFCAEFMNQLKISVPIWKVGK